MRYRRVRNSHPGAARRSQQIPHWAAAGATTHSLEVLHVLRRRGHRRLDPAGARRGLRVHPQADRVPADPADRLHHRPRRQGRAAEAAPEGRHRPGAAQRFYRLLREQGGAGLEAVEPDRLAGVLVFVPRRGRDRGLAARHRRAGQLRRRDRRLHPEHHRRGADLRDRGRRGRRDRRARRAHDGRHADRQGRRLGRPRARHGDRDVHDPQPAPDRARDRHDHLRRADRRRVPRDGARLRPRWPRGRRAHALRTPTTRASRSATPSAATCGSARSAASRTPSASRARPSSAPATAPPRPARPVRAAPI